MESLLIIDGDDALDTYGVAPEEGCYAELVTFYKAKTPFSNNWAEYDSVEVDSTASPVLEPRQVKLKFYIADRDDIEAFVAAITDGSVHSFQFPQLAKTYLLRYSSESTVTFTDTFGVVEITMMEDLVVRPSAAQPSPSPQTYSQGLEIDGIDVARFAILVTEGTLPNVMEVANAKQALSVTSADADGRRYDGDAAVRFAQRQVKLNLHLYVDSITIFWRCYNAFYYRLLSSMVHSLEMNGVDFNFTYQSSDVGRFLVVRQGEADKVWCDFTVTLATVCS